MSCMSWKAAMIVERHEELIERRAAKRRITLKGVFGGDREVRLYEVHPETSVNPNAEVSNSSKVEGCELDNLECGQRFTSPRVDSPRAR